MRSFLKKHMARRSGFALLADLTVGPKGMAIQIRRNKPNQTGQGRTIGIFRARTRALCPIRAPRAWTRVCGRWAGPLFTDSNGDGSVRTTGITGRVIAVTNRCARMICLDDSARGAHSLRAGIVTAALESGIAQPLVMCQTGHRDREILSRYIRSASVFLQAPLAEPAKAPCGDCWSHFSQAIDPAGWIPKCPN